jgi:LmbE family N-acetylglucosaminyl deacetylase
MAAIRPRCLRTSRWLMRSLSLINGAEPLQRLLVIGAHSDDIEIGCGGTILTLTRAVPGLAVDWVVLAAADERESEARASAQAFLAHAASSRVEVHAFRDGFLPYVGAEVKDVFEEMKSRVDPQVVLTHTRDDLHQDHRLVCELTWNTFRNHLVLEYEVPKVDGDAVRPNVFIPLEADVVEEKIELLHSHFPSQTGKHWFDEDLFRGLMRLRGMEANAPDRFAEAFVARKMQILP